MPLTLAEKIAEAASEVGDVAKQGDNGEYTYIRASDLFRELRLKLFKRGIAILPEKIYEIKRSQPYLNVNDNIIDEVTVTVQYLITDGVEKLYVESAGCGQDYSGKALPIALTGTLKSLLKILGLIAATEDDAESVTETERIPPGLAEKLDAAEKEFGPDLREHPIDRIKVNAFTSACRSNKISDKTKKNYLIDTFNVEKISDLKRKDFDAAMKWATSNEAS
jgi:hypothetical protein